MAKALDGPHVGVGVGVGMLTDNVYDYEVQCTRVEPGDHELRLAGYLSEASRRYVRRLIEAVSRDKERVAAALGMDWLGFGKGFWPGSSDLHVYIRNGGRPILPAYQQGPIYVSLVSLLLGRRAREDTAGHHLLAV